MSLPIDIIPVLTSLRGRILTFRFHRFILDNTPALKTIALINANGGIHMTNLYVDENPESGNKYLSKAGLSEPIIRADQLYEVFHTRL